MQYRFITLVAMVLALSFPAFAEDTGELAFTDKEGASHTLSSYQGQGVVLNLWATWCAPCIKEMPAISRLHDDMAAHDINVLAVAMQGEAAPIEAFYAKQSISNLDILMDKTLAAIRAYEAQGLPFTVVLDKDGKELKRYAGAMDWDSPEIRKEITDLLK